MCVLRFNDCLTYGSSNMTNLSLTCTPLLPSYIRPVCMSQSCLHHLADGCRRQQRPGFRQTKRTQEKVHVAGLFSLPDPACDPSCGRLRREAVGTHPLFLFILIVILGHLRIHSSLFCLFSASDAHVRPRRPEEGGGTVRRLPHFLPRWLLC